MFPVPAGEKESFAERELFFVMLRLFTKKPENQTCIRQITKNIRRIQ
jgi:hypothetical protein